MDRGRKPMRAILLAAAGLCFTTTANALPLAPPVVQIQNCLLSSAASIPALPGLTLDRTRIDPVDPVSSGIGGWISLNVVRDQLYQTIQRLGVAKDGDYMIFNSDISDQQLARYMNSLFTIENSAVYNIEIDAHFTDQSLLLMFICVYGDSGLHAVFKRSYLPPFVQ